METVDTTERLNKLRELMRREGVAVYIIPSEDSHQSEYIAPCDARRAFICGFTGSAGTAVITMEKAAMATDGRYFNQASKQLDSNWTLLKEGLEDVPTWQNWSAEQSKGDKSVGVDPTTITASEARKLDKKIKKKGGAGLVGIKKNLVDEVWGDARPPRPKEKVWPLELQFTGMALGEKIEQLRKELEKKKSAGLIVSMLDEVAWLYNLRGSDIPYNPVFFSYAIVTPKSATLYVDSSKFTTDVESHLNGKVLVRPYESILEDVKLLSKEPPSTKEATTDDTSESVTEPKRKFMISTKASWALSLELGGEDEVDEVRSPVGDAKAIKNATEIAGMRACHIRDGAALTAYFAWLEEFVLSDAGSINEVQAADRLEHLRSRGEYFKSLSFDTISSVGPNAAIIHYKPEPISCSALDVNQVYLCDSGAQYLDGTTDVTRTLHFGEPTDFQKHAYTLVLKGVIGLATAVFPKGTTGFALDAFARRALWLEGLDYRHGTGHGVGSYLNVHEGPIGVGTRPGYGEVALNAGNVISDEPGFYWDGEWGIRIENIVVVKEIEVKGPPVSASAKKPEANGAHVAVDETSSNGVARARSEETSKDKMVIDDTTTAATQDANANANASNSAQDPDSKPNETKAEEEKPKEKDKKKPFLTFETVTMVPLCRKLIETSALTPPEREWVDVYHATVREKVWPLLEGDERARGWLQRETEAL